MEPGLRHGDYVLVNRLAYLFGEPSKGDVVVLRCPEDEEKFLIKRVAFSPSPGEYFVMGDNVKRSRDSRHFGPVKMERIIGKVMLRIGREG